MKRNIFTALLLLAIVLLLSACSLAVEPLEPLATEEAPPTSKLVVEFPAATLSDAVVDEAQEPAEPVEPGNLDIALGFLLNLVGLVPVVAVGAPLIAFLVDLLKRLPDPVKLANGFAPVVSGILNLTLYGIFYFANSEQDKAIEGIVQALTSLAPFVLMLFTSLVATSAAHDKLSRIGLGFSRSLNELEEQMRFPKG